MKTLPLGTRKQLAALAMSSTGQRGLMLNAGPAYRRARMVKDGRVVVVEIEISKADHKCDRCGHLYAELAARGGGTCSECSLEKCEDHRFEFSKQVLLRREIETGGAYFKRLATPREETDRVKLFEGHAGPGWNKEMADHRTTNVRRVPPLLRHSRNPFAYGEASQHSRGRVSPAHAGRTARVCHAKTTLAPSPKAASEDLKADVALIDATMSDSAVADMLTTREYHPVAVAVSRAAERVLSKRGNCSTMFIRAMVERSKGK